VSEASAVLADHVVVAAHGDVVEEMRRWIARGTSVVLIGPAGVGKSTLIETVAPPGTLIIDPFRHITNHRAAAIRRALDRGRLCLAAARSLQRSATGHAGRISWRFIPITVPLTSPAVLRRHAAMAMLRLGIDAADARAALPDILRVARGRAAYAAAVICAMTEYWQRHLPPPAPTTLLLQLLESR
jgi:hypothetical protein